MRKVLVKPRAPVLSPLGILGSGCGSHAARLFLAGDVATALHHPSMCSLSCESCFTIFGLIYRGLDQREGEKKRQFVRRAEILVQKWDRRITHH